MTRFAIQRVRASDEAIELIERLADEHGPLILFQPRAGDDQNPALCLTRAEFLPGDDDVRLGDVGGAGFYVDAHDYELAGRPALLVDLAGGPSGRFALAGLEDVHFVTRPRNASPVA